MTAKKSTRKRDALAKLLFGKYKLIAFLLFSWPSPSSLFKLPDYLMEVVQADDHKIFSDI